MGLYAPLMMNTDSKITVEDVARLLNLDCDTNRRDAYVVCPKCAKNAKQKKLNINFSKNVWRCAKCGNQGGPVALYSFFTGIQDSKEAVKDYYKKAKERGFINEAPFSPTPKKENIIYHEPAIAKIAVRDMTYSKMLELCALYDRHKENLLNRGLKEDRIKELGYKSTPKDLDLLCKKLLQEGCTLEGVPGFYKKDGSWTITYTGSGIFIPQRDSKGRIQGLQIRLDEKLSQDGTRFITFSSAKHEDSCGTPAKSNIHFVRGKKGITQVLLTEGPMKADIISYLSGYSVIAVPGVNNLGRLPKALESLQNQGMKKVSVAYDMDLRNNPYVKGALDTLISLLDDMNISHSIRMWDPCADENGNLVFKGLDDYLNPVLRKKYEESKSK